MFELDPGTLAGAAVLCLCGVCNLLVHLLPVPTEKSGTLYKLFMKAVNYGAANFGKAKNASNV